MAYNHTIELINASTILPCLSHPGEYMHRSEELLDLFKC